MSLRARILALFLGLGVLPILLLGIIGYARSMSAVRGLLEAQTSAIAQQVASDLKDRHELRLSELLLLAENAETQRLYYAHSGRSGFPLDSALGHADEYLTSAWIRFGGSYRRIDLEDLDGRRIFSLGEGGFGAPPASYLGMGGSDSSPTGRLLVPVSSLETGEKLGTIKADTHLRVMLPGEALENTFGRSGYTVVVDREEGEILQHPRREFVHQPLSTLLGPSVWDVDLGMLEADSGSFRVRAGDSIRVASFVSLQDPPWTIITTASLEEFAPPLQGARQRDLLIVLLLAGLVAGAFLVTLRRTTASLESLTKASERVGKGDLDPPLPPPGPDEVGRLSAAFGLMVSQVRNMLRRVEETRQMAVMGELASSVSHQIRNPLTSIKLNLQGLEEEAEGEGMSETSTRSLRICLREVANLEQAVRKVLDLARTHPPEQVETSLHDIISESVDLLQRQFDAKGIRIEAKFQAAEDRILADPEELKNVFVNLLVNAEEAMPDGGTVRLATANASETAFEGSIEAGSEKTIRIRIRDDGPGVPEGVGEQVFRPFVTTKPDGTGFGLAVARLAVQEHHGRVYLESRGTGEAEDGMASTTSGDDPFMRGATFVVELPLAEASMDPKRETDPPAASSSEDPRETPGEAS